MTNDEMLSDVVQQALGIPLDQLTSDPHVLELLGRGLRAKEIVDCDGALRRALAALESFRQFVRAEALPPDLHWYRHRIHDWAVRFYAELRPVWRNWPEFDELVAAAFETVHALDMDAARLLDSRAMVGQHETETIIFLESFIATTTETLRNIQARCSAMHEKERHHVACLLHLH